MDLGQIRLYVRNYLESDEEELPDDLIDMWIRDGYTQVVKRESHWPWLEAEWSFTTIAGSRSYPLTDIGAEAHEITTVVSAVDSHQIGRMNHQDALLTFGPSTTGENPVAYSVRAQSLYLWPTPGAEAGYVVLGYREPLDWMATGAGAEPDCPVEFHSLIVRYAIACAYEQQDDTEMATFNKQHFDTDLTALWARAMQADDVHPVIMNGRKSSSSSAFSGPEYPPFYVGSP